MKLLMFVRRLIVILTGILFLVYASYNIFVIVKDIRSMTVFGVLIGMLVAVRFAVLAVFVWTAGIQSVKLGFLKKRVAWFIITILALFALKLRMAGEVFAYLDFTKPPTVFYVISYFLTLEAFLVLFVYYAFILKRRPLFPRAAVLLPVIAVFLFLCSFALEAVLFFAYGVITEANPFRTMIIRPVFYLGFIGLSASFLFPPPLPEPAAKAK